MKKKPKILIVTSRFNEPWELFESASDELKKRKISFETNVKSIGVNGAFEIPVTIARNINKFDAAIAIGIIIRGETPNFNLISPKTSHHQIKNEGIDFVLSKYVEGGVDELDINRLSDLVILKYNTLHDGQKVLGDADKIKSTFIEFQKYLYSLCSRRRRWCNRRCFFNLE